MRARANPLNRVIFGGLFVASSAYAFNACTFTVGAGERALIYSYFGGVKQFVYPPGIHFLIPITDRAIPFDVRIQPYVIQADTGTKDLQKVNVELRVLYRPDAKRLPDIYGQLGENYAGQVFMSLGNEVLKAVIAQYDATELITNRENVSLDIRERLTNRAESFGLELEDVSITHTTFSQEYAKSIESKQVAQQLAERAKFVVLKTEQEKQATVIHAEAEAEAAKLIGEAMKEGTGFVTLRKIEAARSIAEELGKNRNVVYLPNSANLLFNPSSSNNS